MTFLARSVLVASLAGVVGLAGCSASHVELGDGGITGADAPPGDASCGSSAAPTCVSSCGSDAGAPADCVDGAWVCPAGTVDILSCPTACPPGIDPWASPGTVCSTEGAHCSSGGDACGSGMWCECSGGHWSCAVAEPDPVCYCGREPAAGDRCNEEGASCGECCPTPGGTGWPAMSCVGGHWQPAACPPVVCPLLPRACPVDGPAVIGTPCADEAQICGNACCGTAFQCSGGVWVSGPDADCACRPGAFACGVGTCEDYQACTSQCGPTDGIEHTCTLLPDGCTSCDCIAVPAGYSCEMRDGSVFLSMMGFCG